MTIFGDPLTSAPPALQDVCRKLMATLPPSAVLEAWAPSSDDPDWLVVVEWEGGLSLPEVQEELVGLPGTFRQTSVGRLELRGDGWLVQADRHLPPFSALEMLRSVVTTHRCPTATGALLGDHPALSELGSDLADFRRAAELLAALAADPADLWGSVTETYCRFGHFDGLLAADAALSA